MDFQIGFYDTALNQRRDMKYTTKCVITISCCLSLWLFSEPIYAKDLSPYDLFSAETNLTNRQMIFWEFAEDALAVCKQKGDAGDTTYINRKAGACAISRNYYLFKTCTIISKRKPSMATFGYESRHCFQGEFHK